MQAPTSFFGGSFFGGEFFHVPQTQGDNDGSGHAFRQAQLAAIRRELLNRQIQEEDEEIMLVISAVIQRGVLH